MTKKYFVAVSKSGRTMGSQFIAPLRKSGVLSFVVITTGAPVQRFSTVYTGVDLTPEIVFAKMIDSGLVIESVQQTLSDLRVLLERSKSSKLGHVYEPDPAGPEFNFRCLGKPPSD